MTNNSENGNHNWFWAIALVLLIAFLVIAFLCSWGIFFFNKGSIFPAIIVWLAAGIVTYYWIHAVINFTTFVGCMQFAIAFFIMSFICLKHNVLFPNVVLLLFGFAPYKIKFEHGKSEKIVYSRNRSLAASSGKDIAVYQLNNEVFFNVW